MEKKTGIFKDFFGTIRKDLKETNLKTSFGRDLRAVYEFYLSAKEREELAAMGWFRRWLYRVFWLIINILKKLSPFRRLLLLLSIILLFDIENRARMFGGYLVLFIVLLLELKDKLLARDELKAGRAVQAALRPQTCPSLVGWDIFFYTRSANEVGGDLVDCIQLTDDRFAFMLGDVSGKGLGAALLMAQMQASVHALATSTKSIARLVTQLNELYCRGGLSNSFISFIYFDIRPNSGKVTFVNAGHIPPVVIRNGILQEWSKGDAALGLEKKAKYKENSFSLDVDDLFIVYTDGLTEARNEHGDFWGEERFFALLPALTKLDCKSMGERIVRTIDAFIGDAIRSDDLTFLVMKRK